jgi:K+-transporting ATPase ATPase A chain
MICLSQQLLDTSSTQKEEEISMLQGWIQIGITLVLIVAIAPIFGGYIARVFLGQKTLLDKALNPIERLIFKFSGIQSQMQMTVWQYIRAVLYSNPHSARNGMVK